MNVNVTEEGLEIIVALAEIYMPGNQKCNYEFISVNGNIFSRTISPQKNIHYDDDCCMVIAKIDLQNTTEWQQANICQMIKRRIRPLFVKHKLLSDEMHIDSNQTYMLRTIKYSKEPVN